MSETMPTQAKSKAAGQQKCVRHASADDVDGILALLNHYASMGELLPRTRSDVIDNLEHFQVVVVDDEIMACGSLENFTDELAEIRSLMVKKDLKKTGYGSLITNELIDVAKQRKVKRLMALTYAPGFFHKFGFKTVDKSIFPEKIWGICVNCYKFQNCDEIAVLLEL